MNLRTLFFLAVKDLTKDIKVLALVVMAVGSGAMAIIPLSGLMLGFSNYLSETTIDVSSGHVILSPEKDEKLIKKADLIKRTIENFSGVQGASIRLVDSISAITKTENRSVLLNAIDAASESRTTTLHEKIIKGRFLDSSRKNCIIIGSELSEDLKVEVGDSITIQFSSAQKMRFKISGIYSTGFHEIDNGIYMNLPEYQRRMNVVNRASQIIVRLKNPKLAEVLAERLRQWRIQAKVETWKDRLRFVEGLQQNYRFIQRIVIFLSIASAGLATGVLIYTNIQHKIRSIGILKAIGTRNCRVLQLYILEGLLIGISGASVGNAAGSLICSYISTHPLQIRTSLSSNLVTAEFSLSLLILPTLIAISVTLAGSLYPAWRAARTNIIKAIWHG